MQNPIFDRRHKREYLLFGFMAAIAYILPVLWFLYRNRYENLYYLFIGCALFMAVIFSYAYKLIYRPYDKKRAVSMLIAGGIASVVGVIISVILVIIVFLFFFPHLFSVMPADKVMQDSPAQLDQNRPTGLLVMIIATAVLGNFGVGAFISVVTAYAGKRDQRGDKPVSLETEVHKKDITS